MYLATVKLGLKGYIGCVGIAFVVSFWHDDLPGRVAAGWRARLGFLVPPGNPTLAPQMGRLVPPGVALHCLRLSTIGLTGTLTG
jgi:hypothetical protein